MIDPVIQVVYLTMLRGVARDIPTHITWEFYEFMKTYGKTLDASRMHEDAI